ncbi:MAG: sn-glycerol-1-phosphate dehydrogenase [Verrucomicrobia bacterium]|nr:sn-glycerol-1-phosphate dehydrogenase [Verrucomicrobiota bacterium]
MPTAEKLSLEAALASARETRALVLGPGVLPRVPEVFRAQFPGHRAVVVADRQTMAVAGDAVRASLVAAGLEGAPPFVFDDPGLYAEYRFVEQLEAALRTHDAIPVNVGAGTLNDLAKLAAHRVGRAYMCVATAASMDGYTAFGASITFRGAKQTFDCPAPRAVVADTEVIRRAPPWMTASGYADLLAKVTAGADWILADALGVEPIDLRAWSIVQGGLREALADPAGARAGAAGAITPLIEGLMLGGFAMQWSKSSRPASGAEHQFSHLWDMEHHTHNGEAPSHGFKVGVATAAITAFYEQILQQPFERLDVERCVAQWPVVEAVEAETRAMFARDDFVATAVTEMRAKHVTADALRAQLVRLREVWPETRARLAAQLLPHVEVVRRLRAVGAPVESEEIGITRTRLRESFRRAQRIRRRFTVLDLAVRTGTLEPALDGLFAAETRK